MTLVNLMLVYRPLNPTQDAEAELRVIIFPLNVFVVSVLLIRTAPPFTPSVHAFFNVSTRIVYLILT